MSSLYHGIIPRKSAWPLNRSIGVRGVLRFRTFICLPLVTLSSISGRADFISLNPVADTFILNSAPTNNNGGTEGFTVGRDDNNGIRRGLIRFDLSGIPPGSTITSAVLELTVIKDPPQPVGSDFHLFRLLQDWGEGDKVGFKPGNSGAPATKGEASWDARLTDVANWTTSGALDDVAPSPSATTFVAGTGPYTWTNAGVRAEVQLWADQPGQNFGWLIVCANELSPRSARKFGSREPSSNPQPPVLQVGFVAPLSLSAPTLLSPSEFRFTVNSIANTTNVVEVATNTHAPLVWLPLETRVPANDTFTVTDTNAATDAARLYRVIRQ